MLLTEMYKLYISLKNNDIIILRSKAYNSNKCQL